MYDTTRIETFNGLQYWLNELEAYIGIDCVQIDVGNKSDCTFQRQVTRANALLRAQRHNMLYIETSTKQDLNVQLLFHTMIDKVKTIF